MKWLQLAKNMAADLRERYGQNQVVSLHLSEDDLPSALHVQIDEQGRGRWHKAEECSDFPYCLDREEDQTHGQNRSRDDD